MPLDFGDGSFAATLEREIRARLHGDEQEDGIVRTLMIGPTWEAVLRARGMILAYEEVLEIMAEIARRMNEGESLRGRVRGGPSR